VDFFGPENGGIVFSETLVSEYKSTWPYNQEGKQRHFHGRENCRSRAGTILFADTSRPAKRCLVLRWNSRAHSDVQLILGQFIEHK
jgi:hypothetical protein